MFKRKKLRNPDVFFTGVDLGNSKIAISIFKINQFGELELVSMSCQKVRGISNNSITNIDELEESILDALHTAEEKSKTRIKNVYINVFSELIKSQQIENEIDLNGKIVNKDVIKKILNLNHKNYLKENEEIIHIFPLYYQLDDLKYVTNPDKMLGKKLKVTIHVICT